MKQLIAKPTGKYNILRTESIYKAANLKDIKIIPCFALTTKYEQRFIVVSKLNFEILDTADGWGYKSEQAAWNGYRCKLNHNVAKIDYTIPVPKHVCCKKKITTKAKTK